MYVSVQVNPAGYRQVQHRWLPTVLVGGVLGVAGGTDVELVKVGPVDHVSFFTGADALVWICPRDK